MARIRTNAVIISLEEVPHLITALYKQINKDDLCKMCGKPASFIRVEIIGEKIVRLTRLCKQCEAILARRQIWTKKKN